MELRTIKLIVGGMTLVLFIMFGAVAWGLSRTLSVPTPPAEAWVYTLPEGRIQSISQSGAYLAILTETEGGRKVYLFDPATKTVRGVVQGP